MTSDDATREVDLPRTARARAALARDTGVAPSVLLALADGASASVRKALAGNSATPTDVLMALASDESRGTRRAVVDNPATPEGALVVLATDSYDQIRWTVPCHPNCGPHAQRAVLAGDDPAARQNLAGRGDLALDVVACISVDPDPQVRGILAAHTQDPDLLARFVSDASETVRAFASENTLLTQGQLATLATDPSSRVRGHMATFRTDLPVRILQTLACDRSKNVRFSLTMNPQPSSVLAILCNDVDPEVANNAAQWG